MSGAEQVATPERQDRADSPYAWYVLCVLIFVYVFSSMDRAILSILAEDIKKSFAITDTELGFLHGTAFSIFYALFGYPMGRLLDRWRRTTLLAIGIAGWSAMTVFCGVSTSLLQMTAARIGVGIGEAAASPSGFSLVADWFTKRKRATALGLFIGGLSLGSGLSLAAGGTIVTWWNAAFEGPKPFGLQGWQATFVIIGAPGLLLALLVASLREPRRGLADGVSRAPETDIWVRFFGEIASVIPPLTFIQAARCGIGPLIANVGGALLAATVAGLMIYATGDKMQWIILGIGYYAAFSSGQSMKHRDPPTFALTWGTPSFRLAMIGFGVNSVLQIVISFWAAPLALRSFDMPRSSIGLILGCTTAIFGLLGVATGGRIADWALKYTQAGRIWVGVASATIPVPFIIVMCTTHNPWVFFACNVPIVFMCSSWVAAGGATITELVLPRMRGVATTTYFFASTMIGSGLGPYFAGKISTATGSLATGVLCALVAVPISTTALWLCSRRIERDEASKWDRARAAGEAEWTFGQ